MSSPESSTPKSSEVTHLCAPDPYLTEKRLALIFEDFNREMLRSAPSGNVFTHLVNNVRVPYMSQILLDQQLLSEQSAHFERQLSSERAHHVEELATQRVDLEAQHERQLSEFTKAKNAEQSGHIRARGWIANIEVVYLMKRLSNSIVEFNGRSNEINDGFHGDPVWLVPKYDSESAGAMTGIEIEKNSIAAGRRDLTRGADVNCRYLTPMFNQSHCKIHTVNLLRLNHPIVELPEGYVGHTENINADRDGDYLYLIWKTSAT